MNILFVNYGDFTTNSLNHISGFANTLTTRGHACIVAVPAGRETISAIPHPLFLGVTFDALLAKPAAFPDGRPADLIHAWTPREVVRKFVIAYQRLLTKPARVLVHLEDNEEFLIERFTGKSLAELRAATPTELATLLVDGLPHPWRHQNFLRVADGVTVIVESLKKFVPAYEPTLLLPPGVDFSQYHPQPPDSAFRKQLGLRDGEKVIVFTGGTTFANEVELRDLYLAVSLLNQRGTPTRLVRTGFNTPGFLASLGFDPKPFVVDLGFVEKGTLPRLLALADVLVQPGRAGPFNDYRLPSKVPEFLASGRPVILPATNIAAAMEDGREALLLKNGSPEEIVELCQRVFKDAALATRLGAAGAAFARQHFDLTANTAALETFATACTKRAPLADWGTLREGAVSEISLLPEVLRRQVAELPADSPVADLLGQLESLAHQLAQFERAAEASSSPQADQAARLATAESRLAVADKQVLTLEKGLELTKQHAGNLEKVVAELRNGLKRTEERYAVSEKFLSATRRQIAVLDADLDVTKSKLNDNEEKLRLTREHAMNLEQLRASLQRRVTELDAQCDHLSRTLGARDEVIRQRDDKLKVMSRSFSWQVTSPLRFLRRKLVDPWRPRPNVAAAPSAIPLPAVGAPASPVGEVSAPTPASPLAIWHSVDYPQSWSLQPRKTTLRGWCFADDGRKLTAIRAVLPDRTVEGTYGFKRMDVRASVREKPQAEYCGWKIELEFATSDTLLDLEAADESGKWHRFFHTGLRVGEGFGPLDLTTFERWVEYYDTPSADALRAQATQATKLARQPLISVVMPVYNTPEQWLVKAIESVRAQTYPNWEFCIADDASPEPQVRTVLEKFAAEDRRIKVTFRPTNGHISAASNSALEHATGEFVALLDHDDELAPHALFEVATLLNALPETDYIYSDEDKIDEEGRRFEPYFKPDFLPDLFHGQNYTSHLSVYRTALVKAAGGFRVGYEGSQDWDLALRVLDRTKVERVRHIPKILYHWRAIPGSTALLLSEKNYPLEAARKALTDHFARLGQAVELSTVPGDHWRIKYPLPAEAPLVSLLIPTRNGHRVLRRCIESILEKTTYPKFEIIVVDNGSDESDTLDFLHSLSGGKHPLVKPHHQVRVLRHEAPFNYSAINNYAVKEARGTVVGLLNNDLEVITPGWLEEMTAQALRPEIGCVGAMLYYPNDTIQHAGAILGVGGVAGHAFRDFPRGTAGKFNRARLVQNYSAVTAACLVIRKSIYTQVGGLDEKTLAVAFNDIDFCLKVRDAGFRNLWTPFAEFYHHESATRGADDTPEKEERFRREVETMMMRWGPALYRDPAYNPNLTLEVNDFTLASPPRSFAPA
ncbi:MAG TPA: glycosyltransferase [Opitutaceae bacterium]|nr:glycosyltransferase [Opitutaceae bacterium]